MRTPVINNPDLKPATDNRTNAVNWRGQSGRCYALFQERVENFVLKGQDLYLVINSGKTGWIGTAGDIIEDQASRARFRAAVENATAVFRMSAPANNAERFKAQWDIEGGTPAQKLSMAS